jgi:hypothetical protein
MWWIGEGARASIKRARRSRFTIEQLALGGSRPLGECFRLNLEKVETFAHTLVDPISGIFY